MTSDEQPALPPKIAAQRGERMFQKDAEPIIGAAIEVHRHLGPGLLEKSYEDCLCHELHVRGIPFLRQVPVPIAYKGVKLVLGVSVVNAN